MAFGVLTTGFKKKLLSEILDEIQNEQRGNINPSLNLQDDSVFGQINGIFSDKLRELWDVAESVYNSQYPDTASEISLDNAAALTGTTRLAETKSEVTLTANLNPGTTLSIGQVVSVLDSGERFATIEAITNLGIVVADIQVKAESEDFGPVSAPSGTLTVIETPVAGWNTITNALDADPGRNTEIDADFRVRRLQALRLIGAGTVEAIRSNILAVEGVDEAFVFENATEFTDADGLPPKSFETVVRSGDDNDIVEKIFEVKPAGIEAFGTTVIGVADSQGFSHSIGFSRPTEIEIHIAVTVKTNSVFPIDGEDQIKLALADFGDTLGIGDDVIFVRFQCEPLEVDGVEDVTVFFIDTTPSPVATNNIVIKPREIAVFDTSRITVTIV